MHNDYRIQLEALRDKEEDVCSYMSGGTVGFVPCLGDICRQYDDGDCLRDVPVSLIRKTTNSLQVIASAYMPPITYPKKEAETISSKIVSLEIDD